MSFRNQEFAPCCTDDPLRPPTPLCNGPRVGSGTFCLFCIRYQTRMEREERHILTQPCRRSSDGYIDGGFKNDLSFFEHVHESPGDDDLYEGDSDKVGRPGGVGRFRAWRDEVENQDNERYKSLVEGATKRKNADKDRLQREEAIFQLQNQQMVLEKHLKSIKEELQALMHQAEGFKGRRNSEPLSGFQNLQY